MRQHVIQEPRADVAGRKRLRLRMLACWLLILASTTVLLISAVRGGALIITAFGVRLDRLDPNLPLGLDHLVKSVPPLDPLHPLSWSNVVAAVALLSAILGIRALFRTKFALDEIAGDIEAGRLRQRITAPSRRP